MKIDERRIRQAILEIKSIQTKYCSVETMIVYHALDTALKQLGWDFAELLEEEITQCPYCNCMTKTIDRKCGKCKKIKK